MKCDFGEKHKGRTKWIWHNGWEQWVNACATCQRQICTEDAAQARAATELWNSTYIGPSLIDLAKAANGLSHKLATHPNFHKPTDQQLRRLNLASMQLREITEWLIAEDKELQESPVTHDTLVCNCGAGGELGPHHKETCPEHTPF